MSIRPDQVKGEIALELDAPKLSSGDFLRAAESFFGLVNEVAKTLNDEISRDSWDVSVDKGSQIINVYPNKDKLTPKLVDEIVSNVLDGIHCLENSSENPFRNSYKAVEYIKNLGKIANHDKDSIPVKLLSRFAVKPITRNVFNHASQILSHQYTVDTGTVDGILNVVSNSNSCEFRISEILYGKTIKCFISQALLPKALKAFNKRVEVDGLIRYDKEGFPKSVKASDITIFPKPENIPHFSKMKGIYAGT